MENKWWIFFLVQNYYAHIPRVFRVNEFTILNIHSNQMENTFLSSDIWKESGEDEKTKTIQDEYENEKVIASITFL